ncbi:DUF502 domain-containing protein [Lyngbya confervoides]|uniref:DUF502 domain-containing protein n=1 Tax=Lyngbya confervoides BDU141951 TaxID=1574623 RepID=A0ABD4T3J6_9CYAN|nr:DUF502 domain-containing protein [Lyngbya confervoides]MCM1983391.1 DUF502 domain-containing protein [Lyngbya confervoides BDU141951]
MFERLKQDLKNDLIAGLLVVIPLATTIWLSVTIAIGVVTFLTKIPKQLNPFQDLHPILLDLINLLIGFAVPLFSILAIGLMARNIVGQWLLNTGEQTVQAIPLAGSVYKTLKQLLETILRDSRTRFRRVVLVEYPRPGLWAIAFVTGTLGEAVAPDLPETMLSLFIPTSPNPTTGWYSIVPEREVIDLKIPVEDAFKLVISGGIVTPNLHKFLEAIAQIPPGKSDSVSSGDPVVSESPATHPQLSS